MFNFACLSQLFLPTLSLVSWTRHCQIRCLSLPASLVGPYPGKPNPTHWTKSSRATPTRQICLLPRASYRLTAAAMTIGGDGRDRIWRAMATRRSSPAGAVTTGARAPELSSSGARPRRIAGQRRCSGRATVLSSCTGLGWRHRARSGEAATVDLPGTDPAA
ncbi:hypothetical protein Dimus_009001 [Dionaea muscipula]